MVETKFVSESNEAALLWCILNDEEKLLEVIESVKESYFGHKPAKSIYTAITECFGSSKSVIHENIVTYLSTSEINYLNELLARNYKVEHFSNYLNNVKDKFLLRQGFEIINRAKEDINNDLKNGNEVIEEIQSSIDKLLFTSTKSTKTFGDDLFSVIPDPEKYEIGSKRDFVGYSSGIKELDEKILGFNKGSYSIVGGRPNENKTLFVRHILLHNVMNGIPVLLFSLDEPEEIIKLKTISTITGINYNHLKKHELNTQELNALKSNIDFLKEMPFLIDTTPNLTIPIIRSKIKKAKYKYPDLGLVAIDYIQQLSGQGGSLNEILTHISKGIKNLCFEFDIAFLVISQLSRSIENRMQEDATTRWYDAPRLSDLKESGALESDGDKIIFVRAEPPKTGDGSFKEQRDTRLWVMKQRDGQSGVCVKILTEGKTQRIIELKEDEQLLF